MEIKRIFMALIVAGAAIVVASLLGTSATAMMSDYWISPITNLDGDVIEAGSPYSFSCQRSSSEDYYKVLMFLENEDGTGIYKKVSINGYYWLNPTGEYVVYALWVPYDTPTGQYTLRVSLQGHRWIYDTETESYRPWGPWEEYTSYEYLVYVYGHEDEVGVGSVSNSEVTMLGAATETSCLQTMAEETEMSSDIQNTEDIDHLNAAQRSVLLQTLKEELRQRGEI